MEPNRARARELAAASLNSGDPTGWFEQLYQEPSPQLPDTRLASGLLDCKTAAKPSPRCGKRGSARRTRVAGACRLGMRAKRCRRIDKDGKAVSRTNAKTKIERSIQACEAATEWLMKRRLEQIGKTTNWMQSSPTTSPCSLPIFLAAHTLSPGIVRSSWLRSAEPTGPSSSSTRTFQPTSTNSACPGFRVQAEAELPERNFCSHRPLSPAAPGHS